MMRAAFATPEVTFQWNTEVVSLISRNGAVRGVRVRELRTGLPRELLAPAVIIATGGWQNDLESVRREWRRDVPAPSRLYSGAGNFATGTGIRLGQAVGAATTRMDHQVTFTTGIPDPRDPTGARALLTQNPAAIWVDSNGRRFINETGPSKVADRTVLGQTPATHWLVFDADGFRSLRIRDAVWLRNPPGIEPLKEAGLIHMADSIPALAVAAGLPAAALDRTVQRWNAAMLAGEDTDFARFSPQKPDLAARALRKAPYYALQLFPMTRKSMGGLAIDADTRVLDKQGRPIPDCTPLAKSRASRASTAATVVKARFSDRRYTSAGWQAAPLRAAIPPVAARNLFRRRTRSRCLPIRPTAEAPSPCRRTR
jgi:succinate dehydrogenase/fumarate reductase flavoprotein subunit